MFNAVIALHRKLVPRNRYTFGVNLFHWKVKFVVMVVEFYEYIVSQFVIWIFTAPLFGNKKIW